MKRTQDIVGLSVFSVIDGRQVGQVKDLVINPEEGKVDYLLVSDGSWYIGARVLPFDKVMGIGDHAVTTESQSNITSIADAARANDLLQRNVELKNSRLLTDKGDIIGKVNEYELDENSGAITRLYYERAEGAGVEELDAEQVLTYGADVVVVKYLSVTPEDAGSPVKDAVEASSPSPAAAGEPDGAALFKKRQREYLTGKKAIRDLRGSDGQIIIAEGTIITEALIDLVEQQDRFVELSQIVK
jgi:uncharacterized protein YrrD